MAVAAAADSIRDEDNSTRTAGVTSAAVSHIIHRIKAETEKDPVLVVPREDLMDVVGMMRIT